jgi:hypothetical protein
MKEKMLEQFTFSSEFKEKLVLLVMYRNQSVKEVAKSYNLPNNQILNWINQSHRPLFANFFSFPKSMNLSTKGGHFEIGQTGSIRRGLSK